MYNLRTLKYEINKSFCGYSVEAFLRVHGYSKHLVVHLRNTEFQSDDAKTEYGLMIGGELAFTNKKLETGDILTVNILETETSENVVETCIPLDIVYEDEDLMVINKPSGMPVHPSMGHYENTLGNALCYYTHHTLGYGNYVYRVINRLDRDTSGLLIAAKNMLSASLLGDMTKQRELHRTYLAIAEGEVTEASTIDAPLARKEGSVVERCVDFKNGESAITHMSPVMYNSEKDLSLCQMILETGRTHQIRVHMQYLGHPLIGDFLYNPDYKYMDRQALHSYKLSFKHPITGAKLSFTAPLPADMAALFHYEA